MSHRIASHQRRLSSGGGRVFADDAGRLWNASFDPITGSEAVVFSCISDAREAVRAIAVDTGLRFADVADEVLREWLRAAPRMGRLT